MGWLYMSSVHGFAGPRQYLDDQFTYVRPHVTLFFKKYDLKKSGHSREDGSTVFSLFSWDRQLRDR
jgi:hypothetical protein